MGKLKTSVLNVMKAKKKEEQQQQQQ